VSAAESVSREDGFAQRLSLALKAANLSRAQLSVAVGIDKSVVSRWLSGQVQPTNHNLARISAAIAQVHPGFNMTLWTAPRAQFEAAIGLCPPSDAAPSDAPWAADAGVAAQPWLRSNAFLAAVAGILLLIVGIGLWIGLRTQPHATAPSPAEAQTASIAVMPFVNMSGDPAKDYLGDGIAEEILNDLANTPNLRVAARTSSFSFKGKSADIGEIAHKLNVAAVLEGSVRLEGRRVRIVAQLIKAKDGFHLWSARYDRDFKDILAVQDTIARTIVGQLAQKLLPGSSASLAYRAPSRTTIDPDAYTAYLQGRYAMNRSDAEDFLRAIGFFKQAVRLQPDFVAAHAYLANMYVALYSNGERRDTLGPGKEEIATTLRLDPENYIALLADAQVRALAWQWNDADAAMRRLLREHPNEADAHLYYAIFLQTIGLWEKSLAEFRRGAELQPLVPTFRDNIAFTLHVLGREREAVAEYKQELELDPSLVWGLAGLCGSYANIGKLGEAKQILSDRLIRNYGDDRNTLYCASIIAYREHDRGQLQKIAQQSERLYARHALGTAWVTFPFAFLGDYVRAMDWLEKAYADKDYTLFYTIAEPDLPAGLKQTPRWHALMQRPAFQDIARVRAQILARADSRTP